jgi:hypothetical protein
MVYAKSLTIAALATIFGALIWLVIWIISVVTFAKSRFHTDVAIRIHGAPAYFWISMALLFLLAFGFELQRLRRF